MMNSISVKVVVHVVWWIFQLNVKVMALNHNMRMMPLISKWTTFLAAKSKSSSINNNRYTQRNPSLSFSRISHRQFLFQLSSHKDEDTIESPMEDNNQNSSNSLLDDHRSNIVMNKNTTMDMKSSSRRNRKTTTDRISPDPRQAQYNVLLEKPTNIWAFENLFPEPVWDDSSIQQDLYRISNRKTESVSGAAAAAAAATTILSSSSPPPPPRDNNSSNNNNNILKNKQSSWWGSKATSLRTSSYTSPQKYDTLRPMNNATQQIDLDMTQRVEGAVYGIRTRKVGDVVTYDTSLMGEGAVQFRDGIRLSNPLKVNSDRLSYFAQREMARNRLEDAQALYEQALSLDPQDGRAYLGLSKIAQRRRDFQLARQYLQSGIFNSISLSPHTGEPEFGGNPYLLQALGCLQETTGRLTEAEDLYLAAVKSRPSHAAAWIALAQLRVRKLRMNVAAGRICYQTAERELQKANLPPSAHLYTAWGSLERQPGGGASGGGDNTRKARELYLRALECDPRCSVAYLQLGVLETEKENWEAAEGYFEQVLKFDARNSRVLQAYAIMESKRPNGNSRKVIDLFERALRAKPRDAVVLQAYALYVVKLGDVQSARALLKRGTEVDKRQASLWQAWGVLETRYGTADVARDIFQQGIWSCSQLSGGQSGGYKCARLWQAWGILEAAEGDHAAARRCFNRALDADALNVAAITAWALLEEELGNAPDARSIMERAIKQFPPGSQEKMSLWRSYELMEQRLGNIREAQNVYQRSMREKIQLEDEILIQEVDGNKNKPQKKKGDDSLDGRSTKASKNAVEVQSWGSDNQGSLRGEVWMNKGSIEAKVPKSILKKTPRPKRD